MKINRRAFEAVVAEAIAGLPAPFRDGLRNLAITIEERPARGSRRPRTLLLGLYQGIPLPQRTHDDAGIVPDKITLFQANIAAVCRTEAEMITEIRTTVLHELGHYFGLTERQLKALGC